MPTTQPGSVSAPPRAGAEDPSKRSALRLTLLYIVLAGSWIAFSDLLLLALIDDPARISAAQLYKGAIFVLGTGAVLYALSLREFRSRSAARQALDRSDEMLRLVLGSAPLAIVSTDADRRVTLWNGAAERMFGWRDDEVLGREAPIALAEPDGSGVELDAVLEGRRSWSGHETRWLRKDGSPLDVAVWSAPLGGSDGEAGSVLTVTDRSDWRRAEARMRQQLERIASLRAIDLAITGSVDLRVTLNVLLDQVTARLQVDAAAVLLFNEESRRLEFAAGRGFRGTAIREIEPMLGEGNAGRAALERRMVELFDVRRDPGDAITGRLGTEEDFVHYCAAPLIAKGRLQGVLEVFHRSPVERDAEWRDYLEALAGQAAIAVDNASLFEALERSNAELALAYDTTLEGWARTLELRDHETEGHCRRVAEMTTRLARKVGIREDELVHVRRGALLHDIGKIAIPDRVLLKPGPLDDDEWELMRRHPAFALELLSPIAYLRPALDIPYAHHERWDGGGYPRGLRAEEIPLPARVFAIVDAWDAMRSDRPYRKAMSVPEAREQIRIGAGRHFDPRIAQSFLELVDNAT